MSALALVSALAQLVAIGGETRAVELGGVEARASFTWPEELRIGYFPIRVELANRGEADADVRVLARHTWSLDKVEKRLLLAPGESRSFDLLCRAEPGSDDKYFVQLELGGEEELLGVMGSDGDDGGWHEGVLAIAASPRQAAELAGWMPGSLFHLASIGFDELPARHEAYSSLSAVLLDSSGGLPAAEALEPLLAWTRLGGVLVLYGERAADEARRAPGLAAWLEPRFRLPLELGLATSAYACAQGRLVLIERVDPAADGNAAATLSTFIGERGATSWTPGARSGRAHRLLPRSSPAPTLPLRALAAILLFFAIVIGPLNLMYVKRVGRPVLLLFTVPGIALACGVLLVGYGVLAQGLDVKANRHTYTVLDQRARRASTVAAQRLFAGMSPGAGLRPEPGTALYVQGVPESRRRFRFEQSFRIDLTDGALFGDDYLPVRQPIPLVTTSDRTARERLELAARDGGLALVNGLGAGIEQLVLRAGDGSWHRLEAPVEAGGSATLAPCSYVAGSNESEAIVSTVLGAGLAELPPSCYAARLAASPFAGDLGIELNEVSGRHLVLGVLEPFGENAR